MEVEAQDKLPIPVNVPERKDVIPGIGSKEIGIIGIASGIDIIFIFFIYGLTSSLPAAMLLGIVMIAIVITLIKRDRFDENFIDKILIIYKFYISQKKYYYEFYDMYACELKVEEKK